MFMDKIFDIHNHSIWGVDDGATDLETSLKMFEIAYNSGTTDIILTPHNKPERRNVYYEEMQAIIANLRKELANRNLNLRLYPGNEIYYRMDVSERLKNGKASAMAGSRYVLLEYHPADEWEYIKRGVDDMLSEGYWPIVAHVERYSNVVKNIERVYELVDKGCLIQINAESVLGKAGWGYKQVCKVMLKEKLVSFIASDAHDAKKRTPDLSNCVKYVTKKYGEMYAEKIFCINPQLLVEDKII